MSFYINNCNNRRPECINPQQLNNICEKVLIETTRVFDACLSRTDGDVLPLTLSNFTPPAPLYPLTYVSTISDPNNPAVITSTVIDRTDCRPNFAKVTLTINIPLIVNYVDANGIAGTADSSVTVTRTATLCVPQESLTTPIQITVKAQFASTIGSFTSPTTISVTSCIQIIIKVVGVVDLLIPTFGYPCLQICQPEGDATCNALFNQPIYPPRI